jgi:hypothetical protein
MHSLVMRDSSHTVIAGVRIAVNTWRKREGWSRETVVTRIVGQYEKLGGPELTGIVFNPETQDSYDRAHVNADRVYRWLDDESKDLNLLPANFLPFVLAAADKKIAELMAELDATRSAIQAKRRA